MCKTLLDLESNGTCLPLPAEIAVTLLKVFAVVSAILPSFQWGRDLE